MQRLWKAQLDWDSLPDKELLQAWHAFYTSLVTMTPLSIPRLVGLYKPSFAQIIGFADASGTTAYGCCVYLRCVDNAGNVKVSLLCSKSRVNPASQSLYVPRLELNAALLLSKLAWLKTDVTKLKAYVANRVKAIQLLTKMHTWLYVSSQENPADCLSRGVAPHELIDHVHQNVRPVEIGS